MHNHTIDFQSLRHSVISSGVIDFTVKHRILLIKIGSLSIVGKVTGTKTL